jgi:hypothetical protein
LVAQDVFLRVVREPGSLSIVIDAGGFDVERRSSRVQGLGLLSIELLKSKVRGLPPSGHTTHVLLEWPLKKKVLRHARNDGEADFSCLLDVPFVHEGQMHDNSCDVQSAADQDILFGTAEPLGMRQSFCVHIFATQPLVCLSNTIAKRFDFVAGRVLGMKVHGKQFPARHVVAPDFFDLCEFCRLAQRCLEVE